MARTTYTETDKLNKENSMTMIPSDIETLPAQPEAEIKKLIADSIQAPGQMKKQDTIDKWHAGEGDYAGVKDALIEETYRKTSFDGARGHICSISWAYDLDMDPLVLFAEKLDTLPADERRATEAGLLDQFFTEVDAHRKGQPVQFAGHFIGTFDIPFLFQRAVILGVAPPFSLGEFGRHIHDFYDTNTAFMGYSRDKMISQDALAQAMGLPLKPDGIDGSRVWDYYKAGNYDEIKEYNKHDVRTVQGFIKRLKFQG